MGIDMGKTREDIMKANEDYGGLGPLTYAMIVAEPDEHSPLGPSSMDRWLNCPGSVLLCQGLPDSTSMYADEGSFAHHVSQLCRVNNVSADKYIGLTSHCGRFTVDKAFANAVQAFLDDVNSISGDMLVEERVWYDAWVKDGFGTVDDIRMQDNICNLTDLKFGQGVKVYARNNRQMWGYGLGVFQTFGHLYDIDAFNFRINQPRLDHVDEHAVSLKEILLWARDEVEPTAKIAMKPGAPFKAGEHCRWCKAKDTCQHRKQWVMAQMLDELDDMESIKDPGLMSNDDLADAMDVLDLIRGWCNDIEARTLSEVQAGRDVGSPSWKMVAGRSNRRWRSEKQAEAELRKIKKLKVSDFLIQKLITVTQAETLLGKKNEVLEKLIVKPPGSPKLAPPTDPRPAIRADISELDDEDQSAEAQE